MDRSRYYFQILAETAADLSGVRHPHKILESFLLSAQGGLGARGGFAALAGPRDEDFHYILRPSSTADPAHIMREVLMTRTAISAGAMQPFVLDAADTRPWMHGFAVCVVCPLDQQWFAVIGLERALHEGDYDAEDIELLMGLVVLLQTSLRFALFSTQVELLNAELYKRNAVLDRQVFHLTALRELSREISADMATIGEELLLTVLGHFARPQGILVLHDRSTGQVVHTAKGVDAPRDLSTMQVDQLFFQALAGLMQKNLQPAQVERLFDVRPLEQSALGFAVQSGFFFVLREHVFGLILLGPALDGTPPEDDELLLTFVSQAVLHLKNADSFSTITRLNADLAQQNDELRRTIDELTSARAHISMLEAAGKRVAQIVQRRSAELTQVRWIDFVLILGLSIGMGLIFNFQNPRGIPLYEKPRADLVYIDGPQARQLLEHEDAVLVDARPREFFEQEPVPGAINVPAQLFDLVYLMQLSAEDPERPIIVYGRTISRHYDSLVAAKFLSRDHERVFIVRGVSPEELPSAGATPKGLRGQGGE